MLSVAEVAPWMTIGLLLERLGCFLLRGGPNLMRGSACDSILFLLAGNFPFPDTDGLGIVFVEADVEEPPVRVDDEAAAERVASCFGRGATSLIWASLST